MMLALIVDDKEENLYYLEILLQAHGYRVESARHGEEALVKARQSQPDIVISDLLMPVMDGHEFIKFLRSNPATASIPVVVLSGLLDISSIKGANAFLAKPFVMSPLLALVKTYCR